LVLPTCNDYRCLTCRQLLLDPVAESAQATKVMRVAKITRLLKVVKMLRLPLLMQQLEEIVGRALLRMVSFITAALMLIHWVACIFYAVSSIHPHQKSTWINASNLHNRGVFDRSAHTCPTTPFRDTPVGCYKHTHDVPCDPGFGSSCC
jgi:hypothetical protein